MTRTCLAMVALAAILAAGCSSAIGDAVASAAVPQQPPEECSPSSRTSANASDWPCLHGPGHDSNSPETNVVTEWSAAGPPVLWRRPLGRGYSSPVVANGRLVVFSRHGNEEIVECLEGESSKPLWQNSAPTSYTCPVSYSDGPYSTPAIADGRVFAWGAEGRLRCLGLESGAVEWERNLAADYQAKPAGYFPVASSPVVDGNRVYLLVGGEDSEAGIVALDCRTGHTVWKATREPAGYATPLVATIHGRRYLFVFTAAGLVSLDPNDGHVHWSIPFAAKNREIVSATTPVVAGDILFVSGYSLGNLCLRINEDGSYEELWRGKVRHLDSQYNNLFVHQGYVYGFAGDHSLRCLNLLTGDVAWRWKSELARGSTLAVGKRLLVLGERGHLGAMALGKASPENVSLTTESLTANDVSYSSLALSRGLLYFRTEKEMVCVDLRPSGLGNSERGR